MSARLKKIVYKSEFLSLVLIVLVSIAFSIANPAFFNIINIFDAFTIICRDIRFTFCRIDNQLCHPVNIFVIQFNMSRESRAP